MTTGPLRHALGFWKPIDEAGRLAALATYGSVADPPAPGIRVLRSDAAAAPYRLACDGVDTLLYAAVTPLDPASYPAAEKLAEIRDGSGTVVSAVLWYPAETCVVIPFDPDEAIEAFWFERYMPASKKTVLPSPVLSAYYAVRPLIPKSLKLLLRRVVARKTDASSHPLAWPADESCDALMRLLLRALVLASGEAELPFLWFWPDGHPWAVVLTHDVETAAGLANVPHVMDFEQAAGVRSSFNLVPRDYVSDDAARAQITAAGFEIGIHGWTHDGLMFASRSTFLARAKRINATAREWGAVGFRSPATYRNLDWFGDLDIEYDSSVTDSAPFEPQPGGCASVFPYLVGDVTELPMTLPQDHTLFGLLEQTDARVWLAKLDAIRGAHGMACVLTHPDPAGGYIGLPENEAHYREVLGAIGDTGAWVPLPRELARWWRSRAGADPTRADGLAGALTAHARVGADGRLTIAPPAR